MMHQSNLNLNNSSVPSLPASEPEAEGALAEHRETRLRGILKYLQSSLDHDDALESVLGAMNAGVMRLALWLEEAIERTMASGPPSLEIYEQLSAAFTTYLKLMRQSAHLTQLGYLSAQARQAEQGEVMRLTEQLESLTASPPPSEETQI